MKRDMDLARAILVALEGEPSASSLKDFTVDGWSDEEVSYHVKLLHQAELIEAIDASTLNHFRWFPVSLKWAGHEFLDSARDDTLWSRAKDTVLQKTGGMSFDVLKAVLTSLSIEAFK